MGTLHHLAKPSLTPREIKIVAAYLVGEPLSEVCKLYEISPAALGMLMATCYGCRPTAEANSMACQVAAAPCGAARPGNRHGCSPGSVAAIAGILKRRVYNILSELAAAKGFPPVA
jgi:hypothetical protein